MSHPRRILFTILVAFLLARGVIGEDKKPQTIEGWGTVTDPLGDCTIKGEKQKLTVTVPGGTHDLNAQVGGMDAPRVLQSVEGDFTLEVKVTSKSKAGQRPAADNTPAFSSAGLLIWQDDKTFIRLERNKWWVEEAELYACYPPLIEYHHDGLFLETNPAPTWAGFFKGESTWLRLERRGDTVTASYSHDGETWATVRQMKTNLAKQLRAGVVVVNTCTKDLTVEFDELKMTKD